MNLQSGWVWWIFQISIVQVVGIRFPPENSSSKANIRVQK